MADPENVPATIPEEETSDAPTLDKLNLLRASATKEYSLKNYSLAAELYSEATEIQAELNGEMNPDNADLLYAYGRCLYHVAVSNSDVLGGKVASNDEPAKKKRKTNPTAASKHDKSGEEVVEAAVETKDAEPAAPKAADAASKPFFQITGDENWTDSEPDDDEDDANAPDAQDDDEDDFAIAYEILDVARVLLTRKLDSLSDSDSSNTKGKAKEIPPEQTPEGKQIMERLADTHDLQAEISLENERFADAVADEKASLELKLKIFPTESSLVAEAHYKLSLALEFASVTQTQTDGAEAVEAPAEAPNAQVDEAMRKEAVQHMESAIASCKLRVHKETESLAALSPELRRDKEASIKDVTEMIGDMEQRLIDLRDPATSLTTPNGAGGPAGAQDSNPLGGILGTLLGESTAAQKARIAEATKTANDLTGLVKHKKRKVNNEDAAADAVTGVVVDGETNGKSKRKADEVEGAEGEGKVDEGKEGKRVKFEE